MRELFLIGLLTTFSISATWIVSESEKKLSWDKAVMFCKSHKGKLPQGRDLLNASSNKFKKYFKKDFYWSSDENNNNLDEAKYFNFYDKSSYYSPKSFKLNVRCLAR